MTSLVEFFLHFTFIVMIRITEMAQFWFNTKQFINTNSPTNIVSFLMSICDLI